MTELSARMSKPDLVEVVNRGHEAFLVKLRLPDAPDFSHWLSIAARTLCLNVKNVDIRDKMKHVEELVEAVKKGFERKDLLKDLSEEEKAGLTYSKKRFTTVFEDKLGESKTVEPSLATASKDSEANVVQESLSALKGNVMVGGYEGAKCAICMQSFKRPKCLPCLQRYVFCMHCLEKTGRMTIKYPGDMMSCGRCGQEFVIPKEGFDGLENFEGAEKVIEPAQVMNVFSTCRPDLCDVCFEVMDLDDVAKVSQANIYCYDCDKKLCAARHRCHKDLLKSHKVQALEDLQKVSSAFEKLSSRSKTGKISMA